jgi:hypothetical protein
VPLESLYSEKITTHLFREFEHLLDYILEKGDAEFLSTSQVALPYGKKPAHNITCEVFSELLQQIDKSIIWLEAGKMIFSPAEIFAFMTYALKYFSNNRKLPKSLPWRDPLGPVFESCSLDEAVTVPVDIILSNIADIDRELAFSQQSPAEIAFSDSKIPLASAYLGFARMLQNPIPDSGDITFRPTEPLPATARHEYFEAPSWTKESYPAGFTGENICIHCRLQSWTYKPAS